MRKNYNCPKTRQKSRPNDAGTRVFAKVLSEKLGGAVEVKIPLSAAVINEGFANGTIDIGYLSANDLINAKDADYFWRAKLTARRTYKSYWLALKDKPYSKVEDLRGKPIAFASKTSTSGFIIPLWDLRRKNLVSDKNDPEEFFGKGNVFFGTGYVRRLKEFSMAKRKRRRSAITFWTKTNIYPMNNAPN
ncbi:MAG: PhnD/SsuA/transferrin family substrate-binding protein [Blastocatellia bacterium]|nr:PhnD/SsuA/transferrin family substrate-binding protein [Blastocatellia bacterium]